MLYKKRPKRKFRWKKLSPKQWWSIVSSHANINIWIGATRSGKTIASIARWAIFIQKNHQKGPLLMLGRTLATLNRNVIEEMQRIFGARNCYVSGRTGDERLVFYGIEIFILGADNISSVEKIRGMPSLIGCYIDELPSIPEETFIMCHTRLMLQGSMMFATGNPDSPMHWLKKNWIDKRKIKNLSMRIYSFLLTDNLSLTKESIEKLKNELKGTVFYDRYILALWAVAEGVIYGCFNKKKHVIKKENIPTDFDRFSIGVDYGAKNPTVFLLAGISSRVRYLIKEYYYSGKEHSIKLNSEYAKDFADFMAETTSKYFVIDPIPVWMDTSAASLKAEFEENPVLDPYRNYFYIAVPDKNIDLGIARVAIEINENRLLVSEECENTIDEFGSYVWDSKKIEKGLKEEPIPRNNHCMDALRYQVVEEHAGYRPANESDYHVEEFEDYGSEMFAVSLAVIGILVSWILSWVN